jgi:hypothetical protein
MSQLAGLGVANADVEAQLRVFRAVTADPEGGVRAMAVLSGELDVATVTPLHAAARAVATATHPHPSVPLVLDMERVTFLCSVGLHLLEDLHADGIERGWALQVIPPSAPGPSKLLRLAVSRGWLPPNLLQRRALPRPRPPFPPPAAERSPAAAA